MALSHALLGLLAVEPSTGYDLARRFEQSLAYGWYAGHSQIYPELGRMKDAGLIEVVAEGPRRSRTWAITEVGRDALHDWLINTEPNRTRRDETVVRAFFLPLVPVKEATRLLEKERDYIEAERQELLGYAHAIDEHEPDHPFRLAVELGLRVNAAVREWLDYSFEQLRSK